jgi:hypothetical protein
MSLYSDVMDYAKANLPEIASDIEVPIAGRGGSAAAKAVAELMRRINYCPNDADLGITHKGWAWTLKDPIKDPKEALRTYRRFAEAMNADMVKALMHTLEIRAAKNAGLPPPPPPVRVGEEGGSALPVQSATVDDDEPVLPPVALAPRESDQAIEAIVGRLLDEQPLDNEAWAAW